MLFALAFLFGRVLLDTRHLASFLFLMCRLQSPWRNWKLARMEAVSCHWLVPNMGRNLWRVEHLRVSFGLRDHRNPCTCERARKKRTREEIAKHAKKIAGFFHPHNNAVCMCVSMCYGMCVHLRHRLHARSSLHLPLHSPSSAPPCGGHHCARRAYFWFGAAANKCELRRDSSDTARTSTRAQTHETQC